MFVIRQPYKKQVLHHMKYTLGQAAKETGVSKPTLSRAVKKGDLTAEGGGGKPYRIDPSELGRWLSGYRERNPEVSTYVTPSETPETPNRNNDLEAEVDALCSLSVQDTSYPVEIPHSPAQFQFPALCRGSSYSAGCD